MPLSAIQTPDAPPPIGPYAQAIDTGSLVFISGQIPLDPVSGNVTGATIEEQAARALMNLKAVLSAAGLTPGSLVKTTVLLRSMNDFAAFNAVYGRLLDGATPARSVVEAGALPRGAMVEIEAVACR
jgi:2-iminobutanoate/2-iminopropanoate deaminase